MKKIDVPGIMLVILFGFAGFCVYKITVQSTIEITTKVPTVVATDTTQRTFADSMFHYTIEISVYENHAKAQEISHEIDGMAYHLILQKRYQDTTDMYNKLADYYKNHK